MERIKITFETVTNGEYTIVDKSKVEEANQQVKAAMKDMVRKINRCGSVQSFSRLQSVLSTHPLKRVVVKFKWISNHLG